MHRVAVHGAAGKMGRTACRAVAEAGDCELAAAVDPSAEGAPLASLVEGADESLRVLGSLSALDPGEIDVLVDFSCATAALDALRWCASGGVGAVSGTTGLGKDAVESLRAAFGGAGAPACVIAANFSISAVLAMRLAEIAAAHFDSVEVVEMHHAGKLDAPSGTAVETVRRIAAARAEAGAPAIVDATLHEVIAGSRGAVADGGIHLHSIRLPGLVAHEEIVFGALGQSLTIRQDSYDRSSFMPGVLAAVRALPRLSGLVVGLEEVLGL